MAPEVVNRKYDMKCDIYGHVGLPYTLCSLVQYLLEEKTMNKIIRGKLNFENRHWVNVSTNAKDLIEKLLAKDVNQRISAKDAL